MGQTQENRTLRCLFCGTAHAEFATVCPLCATDIAHVVCPTCNAWNAGGEVTCRCGTRLVYEARKDLPCPRCAGGTLKDVSLGDGGIGAHQCDGCMGLLLGIHDWTGLLDRASRGEALPMDRFAALPKERELPKSKLLGEVKCPQCAKVMERATFGVRSAAVVDICTRHGLWLDAGELTSILSFVKSREDGNGVVPFAKDEWESEKLYQQNQLMAETQVALARQVASNKVLTDERRSAKKLFIASIVLRFL